MREDRKKKDGEINDKEKVLKERNKDKIWKMSRKDAKLNKNEKLNLFTSGKNPTKYLFNILSIHNKAVV